MLYCALFVCQELEDENYFQDRDGEGTEGFRIGYVFPLTIWLVAINIITGVVYGYDKWRALRGEYRVRESHLLTLALVGGVPGAILAMKLFRHKISKKTFQRRMRLIVWLQITLAILVLLLQNGWLTVSIW